MQLTPAGLDAIFYGFDLRFQGAVKAAQPLWQRIADEIPSMGREERYPWLDRIPKFREWVGERVIQNIAARFQTIVNKDYELTLEVDRNDILDDKIGLFNPKVDMMGQQAAYLPDDLIFAALVAATAQVVYDGQYFFDTDHPVNMDDPASATQSNSLSLALNSANYAAARAAMMSFKGADGRPLNIVPNLLMVPPALEQTARQIVNADMIPQQLTLTGPAYAGVPVSNVMKGTADVLVAPQLAGTDTTWYLFDTTKPMKPFIYQNRQAPQFTFLNRPDSENLFFRKKFIFGADARAAAGYGLWQLALKSTP